MVNPTVFIEGTQLAAAVATLYTSKANVASVIKKLTVTNADAAAGHTVTIYLVPAAGAAGAANVLIDTRTVGPLATLDIEEAVNQILAGGDFIAAFADAAAQVSIRCSGVQIA